MNPPPLSSSLIDSFGRAHRSLRVSVTDRCNLRCSYCMPAQGLPCSPRSELLSFEEITFVVGEACKLGVRRIRLTGGEPLLRRDLPELVRMLKTRTAVADVALTTNGLLLDRHAAALKAAGLDRVNVSLDSLDPERFREITRNGTFEQAWRGLEAALEQGFAPVRVNTLLLAGINDDELDRWIELTRTHPVDVRFMEIMPIGEGALHARAGRFVNLSALIERLIETRGLEPASAAIGNGPARYYRAPGARGRLGFITPISNPYCNTCARLRLTSTGELRACLAVDQQVSLKQAARAGDAAGLRALFEQVVAEKPAGHQWREGHVTAAGMSALGG
ncbi:GTP 3',8-cyclase MoaA [Lujinxingia litoralis]|uniref:GTP 3',8-cyclase n=1 Tax=Lujinxingia litoralis TaxID=2211119 RepID=A0A328C310_9DELT|nr:GTP 3',8-cyclase MoaA [Lujinxingia litoralis]RAL21141.1 GTP 3',8-cyclase MoaA [Lujinxingia litoralis]